MLEFESYKVHKVCKVGNHCSLYLKTDQILKRKIITKERYEVKDERLLVLGKNNGAKDIPNKTKKLLKTINENPKLCAQLS